ncbi:TPA: hypothetical protein DD449_02530 [Candidatus Berkelbacteria bacterium]|nr:hypothetical protein [Candidatus Berkelbacteria bacterium]
MAVTKDLSYLDELENLIQKLVLTGHKEVSVEHLSKTAGKSTSLVYKAASPNDDTPFPLAWLPAFMNLKDDYDLLSLICELTGHLPPAKLPRYAIDIEAERKTVKRFVQKLHRITESFEEYLEHPNARDFKVYKATAEDAIKEILSSIHYAKKAVKGIGELEL